ncbi:mediator of RNA polymerase II transcription subunit 4-like [Watersipora subatra]|uniref:mediator of RNA polymerase II transcription subunit 4-like n=1 Tax=Watersipora subatra TaxID=2589382 RepID=UPI00355AFBA0
MAQKSTKQSLHLLLNDIELLSKEVFEQATTSQANRSTETTKVSQILEVLVKQHEQLQEKLKIAEEQAVVQQRIDQLNVELDKKNGEILSLQKNLKDAETILASAVFDAKKKLASIKKAEEKAVSADDLIRFAHRISASGAVAAPPTWVPGDPSCRPYPTDTEMRQGFLSKNFDKLKESYINQSSQPQASQSAAAAAPQTEPPILGFNWQNQQLVDTPTFLNLSSSMNMKQNNDVEIMSQSESSSSSSSDEQ